MTLRPPPAAFRPERFENGRPMLLAGLRGRHEFTASQAGIAEQWREFESRGEPAGKVGANRYGVMCGADATSLEYMCAVEVSSFAGLADGTGRMRVPPQRYAVFVHGGDAATLQSTWRQILDWLAEGELESAHTPDFEVYGGDSAGRGIEVWVGVKARGPR